MVYMTGAWEAFQTLQDNDKQHIQWDSLRGPGRGAMMSSRILLYELINRSRNMLGHRGYRWHDVSVKKAWKIQANL
jgi:hypothetical protein